MTARTLTQLAVVALAVIALALAAVLVLRESSAGTQPEPAAATGRCDLDTAPPAFSPSREDTVLLLSAEKGVALTLDGKPEVSQPDDPQAFAATEHTAQLECGGQKRELTFTLAPFTPAALHAGCGGFTTFALECDDCATLGEARKAAARAGKSSALFAASAAQERLAHKEKARASKLLLERWNRLTERYSRVLGVVGREAPGAVASANSRFEQLSDGFGRATQEGDLPAADQSIRTAEETLKVFVRAARQARPGDCDYQQRLTRAF
ncbi:MAG: hypothetical protein IPJ65_34070 [Archangiaceae bacterium]|nr:hypothetical protein [Archangiaceae bacterium]